MSVKSKNNQTGFTLVEMAIVLLIIGLVVGAVFSFLSVQHEQAAEELTKTREQKIANALAYYAQTHNNLPCPSLPTVNPPGDPIGDTCTATIDRIGIVPFRVLGLSQADVTDAWNNPITYTISAKAHKPDSTNIEATCRNTAWIQGGFNQNLQKAAFCCQPDNSLQVYVSSLTNGSHKEIQTEDDPVTPPAVKPDYKSANTPATAGVAAPASIAYFAYVLISHGKNGLGSFHFCQDTAHCLNDRHPWPDNDVNESKNAYTQVYDANTSYVSGPRNTSTFNAPGAGVQYFDDIVLWRTQDRVISEFNNESCATPN